MRLLILNWKDVRNPDVGGAEIIAFEFARRFVSLGDEVTWFCRSFPGAAAEETIEGIRVVRRGGLLTTYARAVPFYLRLRPRPDLVLDMVNTIAWQAPLYAQRRTVAYVNQLAAEVFFYHLPWPISRVAYTLERFQFLTYRRTPVLCYSESTKTDLIRIGLRPDLVRTFPLGLDHQRYTLGSTRSPEPLFVFVGRLAAMKRADLCVDAMRKVVDRHPTARLAVVGYGPEEERLRSQIRRLGLEDAVSLVTRDAFYLDSRSGDRKVELMQQAWALVLPSVKEGWGMVVTEAAACGTPSIVTDVTGLRDSVRHLETGLIISSHPTADELAEAIIRLIEDQPLRARLEAGAVRWAERFDWETSFRCFRHELLAAAGIAGAPPARHRDHVSP